MDLEKTMDLCVCIKMFVPSAGKIPCEVLRETISNLACGNIYDIDVLNDNNGEKIWSERGGCSSLWR